MSGIARSTAVAVAALCVALLFPATASAVTSPPPDAVGAGASGSVALTPGLSANEIAVPSTYGLGRPVTARMGEWESTAGGHSGVSSEPGNLVVSDQIFVENEAVLKFVVTSGDPAVELAIDVTWIEQGDLTPSNYPRVDTPGTVDTFQVLPLYGLWLIDVTQLSGGSGVPVEVTVTTAPREEPLALAPPRIDAASPTLTATWSDLEPQSTYLGLVQWDWRTASLVEVRTGEVAADPVKIAISSALSSSIQLRGRSNSVLVAAKAADGSSAQGAVQVIVDGELRTSVPITVGAPAIRVPLERLPRGVHRVQVAFVPADGSVTPASGSVMRLYAL